VAILLHSAGAVNQPDVPGFVRRRWRSRREKGLPIADFLHRGAERHGDASVLVMKYSAAVIARCCTLPRCCMVAWSAPPSKSGALVPPIWSSYTTCSKLG